ncbi:MAG: retropepsin-like domain-containing protein [Turicibacter sp.]|nr:retropepsin-like domain-containing protein [Turicibacter sp.]
MANMTPNQVEIAENGRIYYDLYIKPFDEVTMRQIRFQYDTGADNCLLDIAALNRLGYTNDWIKTTGEPKKVYTADLKLVEECFVIKLPNVTIGKHSCTNFHIVTSLSAKLAPLLGLNFIKFCNWFLDYEKAVADFKLIREIFPIKQGDFGIHFTQGKI